MTHTINLEKEVTQKAVRLLNLAKPAKISLEKNNVSQIRARVGFVLDCSGSMNAQFKQGYVQAILDRIAVLAIQFDDDANLDFWAFAEGYKKCSDVTLANLDGYINELESNIRKSGKLGSLINNEPPVMQDVLDFYADSELPVYLLFISDGGVKSSKAISAIVKEASSKPIFWQFVGLGGKNYGVLEKLDTMDGRVCDNANFFAIDDFANVKDEELYDRLLNEFPLWLTEAKNKKIFQ